MEASHHRKNKDEGQVEPNGRRDVLEVSLTQIRVKLLPISYLLNRVSCLYSGINSLHWSSSNPLLQNHF